ncbi:hypothetical protein WJX72_009701 [[Myrmecia] bisecta]|uniref:Uncharacterized protein n=1 Tax=[Myrmecia] bisecta TaxID=41462 RepID=A0AAW1QG78_9CHLO
MFSHSARRMATSAVAHSARSTWPSSPVYRSPLLAGGSRMRFAAPPIRLAKHLAATQHGSGMDTGGPALFGNPPDADIADWRGQLAINYQQMDERITALRNRTAANARQESDMRAQDTLWKLHEQLQSAAPPLMTGSKVLPPFDWTPWRSQLPHLADITGQSSSGVADCVSTFSAQSVYHHNQAILPKE